MRGVVVVPSRARRGPAFADHFRAILVEQLTPRTLDPNARIVVPDDLADVLDREQRFEIEVTSRAGGLNVWPCELRPSRPRLTPWRARVRYEIDPKPLWLTARTPP